MFIRICFIIGLSFSIISCGFGPDNSNKEDAYFVADRLVKSLSIKGKTTDPWLNGVFKLSHEQCYNGVADNNNNTCVYKIDPVVIEVTQNEIKNGSKLYDLKVIQSYKIGKYVYALTQEHDLWSCTFGDQCTKKEGKYRDILAVDFDENVCSSESCKSDGDKYRSLLVLTEPQETNRGSYYVVTSNLQQIFTNVEDKDNGENIFTRASISNDVPIAESAESGISQANILDYSFTMVTESSFNIQLIYERHQNKGGAYQTYYGGFKYGQNLIKQNISKNDNPVRVNKLDHLTLFTPVAQPPLFEGKDTYFNMLRDVRIVAGGEMDTGDDYQWCYGLRTYCDLGVRYGYDAIKYQNHTTDWITNLVMLGAMMGISHGIGAVANIIGTKLAAIGTKNIFVKVGVGSLKLLNTIAPFVGNGAVMALAQVYGMQLNNLYYRLTTNDYTKNLPLLSITAQKVLNMPKRRVSKRSYGTSKCEVNMFKSLSDIELEYKLNPNKINLNHGKTLYDIYLHTEDCDSKYKSLVTTEHEVIMKQVMVDSLRNLRSSLVGLFYQKLFIDTDNTSKSTIEVGQDDLEFFDGDISLKDSEQPAADVSLRLTNCRDGSCDATYFQDRDGKWLKNKKGKDLAAVIGNFLYVYYYKTDDDFRVPFISAFFNPANIYYGINVYQLSDLTCDEFNKQMARISADGSGRAMFASLRNRDEPGVIVDKMGNTCNYPGGSYKSYKHDVYRYNPDIVGAVVQLVPLGPDIMSNIVLYAINGLMDVWNEIQRLNALNPYDFSVRNGRRHDWGSNNYDCNEVELKLADNGKEKLKQVSPSRLPRGGLWVIGDQALHYIDNNDNEKARFTFNQFGTGVASSYNGKLLVAAQGHIPGIGMTYLNRYDERKLLALVAHAKEAHEEKLINIDDYKEGHYPNVYEDTFRGKVYADHRNRVYVTYRNDRPRSNEKIVYLWDIDSWSQLGWIHSDDGPTLNDRDGAKSNPNFALTSDDMLVQQSLYNIGIKGVYFNSGGDNKLRDIIDGKVFYGKDNPYVFTIGSQVFTLVDDGKLLGTNSARTTIKMLDAGTIPLIEASEDATGLDDGRFYLLGKKKLYSCKMLTQYLDKIKLPTINVHKLSTTYVADSLKINFINRNEQVSSVGIYEKADTYDKIQLNNLKYDEYSNSYVLNTPNLATSLFHLQGAPGDLNKLINEHGMLRIFLKYPNTPLILSDAINVTVNSNGIPEVTVFEYVKKSSIFISRVSNTEFNVLITPRFEQNNIPYIAKDNDGKEYIQAVGTNYLYNNYMDQNVNHSPIIIINNKPCYLLMSKCSSGNKLQLLYSEVGEAGHFRNSNISYIHQVDNSMIDVVDFCKKSF